MPRIVKTGWKLLYIVGAVVAIFLVNTLLRATPWVVAEVLGNAFFVLVFAVGTRSFRGRDEPLLPPRAWWRMTSRPTAGFVVASLFAVFTVTGVVFALTGLSAAHPAQAVSGLLFDGLIATAYAHSSVRLLRHPPATQKPLNKVRVRLR
ncbi:hypothetical protein N1031_18850 [Herbiconiux moechotypicola]|uniref:hypothetical protein n=1 Tax=Herbiconiux moechotypicola TaxID=637393 RepID=UPI00217DB2DD|nr:hypothetical protein [Herbiconiux moechotypicola]MCS5731819.1 hypothetical protein [Herbiconiux moechotypicola]